jgi:hypothetical protein
MGPGRMTCSNYAPIFCTKNISSNQSVNLDAKVLNYAQNGVSRDRAACRARRVRGEELIYCTIGFGELSGAFHTNR